MLMRVQVDFHHVDEHHAQIHERLINWALWLRPSTGNTVSPMFRQAKSNAWQWHTPEIRETCDVLDALKMERAMRHLPKRVRVAIKWCYVERKEPHKMRKILGVTDLGLWELVREGRAKLCGIS